MNSPLTCHHANEVPAVCPCSADCVCRTAGSCVGRPLETPGTSLVPAPMLRRWEEALRLRAAYVILRVAREAFLRDQWGGRVPSLMTAMAVITTRTADEIAIRGADLAFVALAGYRTPGREEAEARVRQIDERYTPHTRLYLLDNAAWCVRQDGEHEARSARVEVLFEDIREVVWAPDGSLHSFR